MIPSLFRSVSRSRTTAAPLTASSSLCSLLALLALGPLFAAGAPASLRAQEAHDEDHAHDADTVAVDRWTPELSMGYRSISGTALSPDGEHVAFVVRTPVMEGEKSEYDSQIWVAATDGSWSRQFTRGEASAGSPAFSPDGQWLLFTTRRADGPGEHADQNQVWALPMAGGEAVQVTDAPEGVNGFALAPDGHHLVFSMTDPEDEAVETAKKEKRWIETADRDFRFTHLYMGPFDTDGTPMDHFHPLTSGDYTVTGFDWAPDGSAVAFTHAPDPRINTNFMAGDLSVVFTAHEDQGDHDFEIRHLVTTDGQESNPRFSPDGRTIAFRSSGIQPEPVGLGDVYVVAATGGVPRKLANTHDRSAGIVGWTGDGDAVLVVETVGTTRHLQAAPLDGGAVEVLSSGDGVMGSPSFTPDGRRMAFTWETPDTPWDVYVSPVNRWRPERVTDLHAEVPRPAMGRTELITWTSQDGRFEIEGLLTYPVDYQEGRNYPLILNVHGGPAGAFTQGFTGGPSIYMIQTFAQEGYAVLRPNPRGSTGYGKEFRYANVRDWGYGDMDDLMAGVDKVIEMGVGDPDRLLLMGWSYGGYMTSFAVTRTDRFKAASMGAGLPNLISMVTTTDIQDYLAAHLDSEFWEDYEAYERHSAIYRIDNVTTPTQVIHGANDLRVPFTQGQEFYRALDRKGVDTEFLILPRTPHGPREPKLLMGVTPRIMEWFEKYVQVDTPPMATDEPQE